MPYLGQATNLKTGEHEQLFLSQAEREQSTYIIGTTGTGKTTLLRNMVVEDMWNEPEAGLCVLDPHGDLTEELLEWIPPERVEDVVYLNPMDVDRPFGLNLLACDRDNEHEVRWVVSTVMETLHRLYWYSWGPRLEYVLHSAIRTALRVEDITLVELLLLLVSRDFRDEVVGGAKDASGRLDPRYDHLLISFWHDWFFKLSSHTRAETVASTVNKISPFLLDSMMRNIIGQQESTVDLRKIMDRGQILLVNLSKGDLGENNSALLGSVLVNLILIAALRRRGAAYQGGRRRFHVVVDEYQNFANPSFSILQSEARKFGVDVIVAHQYRDQLDEDSQGASLNVGNIISFRVSGRDSRILASQFDNTPPVPEPEWQPERRRHGKHEDKYIKGGLDILVPGKPRPYSDVEAETANRLSTLRNYQAMCRLVRRPAPKVSELGEYLLTTHEVPQVDGYRDPMVRARIEARCRDIYGRPREEVERAIFTRTGGIIDPTVAAYGLVDPDE